jgi:putative DNA primase/helicase
MYVLGQFIAERCTVHEDLAVQSSQLYAAWKSWCETNGEMERSNKWLTQRIVEKGYGSTRRKNGAWFLGIGLNADNTDAGDGD